MDDELSIDQQSGISAPQAEGHDSGRRMIGVLWLAHGLIALVVVIATALANWMIDTLQREVADRLDEDEMIPLRYAQELLDILDDGIWPGTIIGLCALIISTAFLRKIRWAWHATMIMTWAHLLVIMPLFSVQLLRLGMIPRPAELYGPIEAEASGTIADEKTVKETIDAFNWSSQMAGHATNVIMFIVIMILLVWMLRKTRSNAMRADFKLPPQ